MNHLLVTLSLFVTLSLSKGELVIRVPHGAAVVRRKTVAIHVDDVDVAGTQGNTLLEQLAAAFDKRTEQTVANLFVAYLLGRNARSARLFGKKLVDGGIRDRLAPFAHGLVVLKEAGHRLLTEPFLFDEALEHVGAAH